MNTLEMRIYNSISLCHIKLTLNVYFKIYIFSRSKVEVVFYEMKTLFKILFMASNFVLIANQQSCKKYLQLISFGY